MIFFILADSTLAAKKRALIPGLISPYNSKK